HHGVARYTGRDLDPWLRPELGVAHRVGHQLARQELRLVEPPLGEYGAEPGADRAPGLARRLRAGGEPALLARAGAPTPRRTQAAPPSREAGRFAAPARR